MSHEMSWGKRWRDRHCQEAGHTPRGSAATSGDLSSTDSSLCDVGRCLYSSFSQGRGVGHRKALPYLQMCFFHLSRFVRLVVTAFEAGHPCEITSLGSRSLRRALSAKHNTKELDTTLRVIASYPEALYGTLLSCLPVRRTGTIETIYYIYNEYNFSYIRQWKLWNQTPFSPLCVPQPLLQVMPDCSVHGRRDHLSDALPHIFGLAWAEAMPERSFSRLFILLKRLESNGHGKVPRPHRRLWCIGFSRRDSTGGWRSEISPNVHESGVCGEFNLTPRMMIHLWRWLPLPQTRLTCAMCVRRAQPCLSHLWPASQVAHFKIWTVLLKP